MKTNFIITYDTAFRKHRHGLKCFKHLGTASLFVRLLDFGIRLNIVSGYCMSDVHHCK